MALSSTFNRVFGRSIVIFFGLTLAVSADQRSGESTKTIKNGTKQLPPKNTTTSPPNKKRFIGIWTADYMQSGISAGAIVNNIAKNSPAEQVLRLDDVILFLDGKKVLSSQDVIDVIPLIPSSRNSVVFDILRNKHMLSVSCECLYIPPIDLTPLREISVPCSLRVVLDGSGNTVIVAPMAYVAHLYNERGFEIILEEIGEITQLRSSGVYNTLEQGKWYAEGFHDFAIPTALFRRDLQAQIMRTFSGVLAHFNETEEKQSCYVIQGNDKTEGQKLVWSVKSNITDTNKHIGEYNFTH